MLKRMQARYASKPVQFLLVPSNQFGQQEPGSNAEVKAFAEKSLHGRSSNILMLAKSSLNGVPCTPTGEDSCSSTSSACCPANDAVYDFLLTATRPGVIKWNFDKIIIDVDGRPYEGETMWHSDALDDELGVIVDRLLAKKEG